jgi:membrane protein DedA with SNARE-associated domain/rhodanese-related sulfurtransferase
MQYVINLIEQHGLLVVFLNALLAQGGFPLPLIPILMMTAALASQSAFQILEVVLAAVCGTLIADFVQYWCGRRYGQRFLGLLCKISFSPDFCVRRTEEVFARIGPWSLILAKFIPGLSLISVAMAGVTKMSVLTFLLLDLVGGSLFIGIIVALGVIFQDAISSLLSTLVDYGKFGVVAVLVAIGLYVFIKWLQRRLFIRQLRMDRITVTELRQLINDGQTLLILDVRPKEIREHDGIIPGAVSAHPADIDPLIMNYPREAEIVVYCACPNEESAATAAKHLKRAGFKKIRPLLGGIDAWVQAGHSVKLGAGRQN